MAPFLSAAESSSRARCHSFSRSSSLIKPFAGTPLEPDGTHSNNPFTNKRRKQCSKASSSRSRARRSSTDQQSTSLQSALSLRSIAPTGMWFQLRPTRALSLLTSREGHSCQGCHGLSARIVSRSTAAGSGWSLCSVQCNGWKIGVLSSMERAARSRRAPCSLLSLILGEAASALCTEQLENLPRTEHRAQDCGSELRECHRRWQRWYQITSAAYATEIIWSDARVVPAAATSLHRCSGACPGWSATRAQPVKPTRTSKLSSLDCLYLFSFCRHSRFRYRLVADRDDSSPLSCLSDVSCVRVCSTHASLEVTGPTEIFDTL